MQIFRPMQDVPGGKVNILEGHSIGHSKQNSVIPNGFRNSAVALYSSLIWRPVLSYPPACESV
jgi:hypothetical protein